MCTTRKEKNQIPWAQSVWVAVQPVKMSGRTEDGTFRREPSREKTSSNSPKGGDTFIEKGLTACSKHSFQAIGEKRWSHKHQGVGQFPERPGRGK